MAKKYDIMKSFPTTKEAVKMTSENIIAAVKEGSVDPLQVRIMLGAMEKIFKDVKDNINEEVFNECDKYEGKTFDAFGAKISVTERKSYDYSGCNKWNELKQREAEIAEKRKALEKQLQYANTAPVSIVNEEDGSVAEYINSVNYSTTKSISVTLK